MKRLVFIVAILVAAVLYLYSERTGRQAGRESVVDIPEASGPDLGREMPQHPVPEQASESDPSRPEGEQPDRLPLPALEDSDEPVVEALEALLGAEAINQWLVSSAIIERTVMTINSLDGEAPALRSRPLRHVPGLPDVIMDARGGYAVLSPDNSTRYAPLIRLLNAAEPAVVVALYFDYYPLFQEAFDALGQGDAYFNDRVVEIIDHLLTTPEVTAPIELVRPEVFYEFADPNLESLSFGRKILIRAGPENAAKIKVWLRQIRGELADLPLSEDS